MIRTNFTKKWPNITKSKVILCFIFLIITPFCFQQNMMAQQATEFTQILNYGQLVAQRLNQLQDLANQIQMIQNQLKSTASYQDSWGNIDTLAGSLTGLIQQSQAISSAVNQDYLTMQTNDASLTLQTNLFAQQTNWRNATNSSVTGALFTVNSQNQAMNQENQELQLLLAKSDSAVGETQALQTLNKLVAELINEVQELRQLEQSQLAEQSAYIHQEMAEKQKVDTVVNAMFQPFDNSTGNSYEMSNTDFTSGTN